MLTSKEVADQWPTARGYCDTASYGLPPTVAWDELQAALADWRYGRTSWEGWARAVERTRRCLARLLGVDATQIATGATVSELVSLLAASIPDGSQVLTASGEFTSLIFPWAAHADRKVGIADVPLEELASSVSDRTTVVAVSAVQSGTGAAADLDALRAAAADYDVLTVLDVTQSMGWLPCSASEFDAVVGAGYKWLLAPRGVAFMYVNSERWPGLKPLHAGWFAGADPFDTYYGLPLRLAPTNHRYDTSPAWFSWVGAAPALELLEQAGIDTIHDHNTLLANRLRAGIGLPTGDTPIVCVQSSESAASARFGRQIATA